MYILIKVLQGQIVILDGRTEDAETDENELPELIGSLVNIHI